MVMMLEKIQSGASKVIVPFKALGDAFIANTEQMLSLQMNSGKFYSDVGFSQLKNMATIGNLAQASDFVWGQVEPIGAVNKQLQTDWESMLALQSKFSNDVKVIFSSVASNANPAPGASSASKKVASIIPAETAPAEMEKPKVVTKISKAKRAPKKPTAK